jgi:hypothetical protein
MMDVFRIIINTALLTHVGSPFGADDESGGRYGPCRTSRYAFARVSFYARISAYSSQDILSGLTVSWRGATSALFSVIWLEVACAALFCSYCYSYQCGL